MKGKLSSFVRKATASLLAAATILSPSLLQAAPAYAAGAQVPVTLAEKNPFDNLLCAKHSSDVSAHNANIMEVTIDGQKYLAYCLNHNRYGSDNVSGGSVGSSGYNVEVYDLDDPALQNMETFKNDRDLMLAMQGVISVGGYTGGGDAAAQKLMDPYDQTRPLYHDHFQAYAVTKYAMWSLASGWVPGNDWRVNSSATYKPEDSQYMLQSLINIYGSGTNWTGFNDENIYAIAQDPDGDGDFWQTDFTSGLEYIEFRVETGMSGNNKDRVRLHTEYTVEPADTLPEGFYVAKSDGTKITGVTTLAGGTTNAWESTDKFRVYAEAGADKSLIEQGVVAANVKSQVLTFGLKYGLAITPSGYNSVQNYALVPENGWKTVSAPVKIQDVVDSPLAFTIKKVDGGKGLAGAEFHVTGPGGFDRTYTTPSSGTINVDVRTAGTYTVQETKAPSGYALDDTEYTVDVQEGGEEVILTIENSKKASLRILKRDAQTGESLQGAVFTVRNIDTGWETDVMTGDSGSATLSDLQPGSYEITEKTPPPGYLPAENPTRSVQIEPDGLVELIYENEPITGFVKIIKTAENNGDPLEGVTFEIRRRDGAEQWSVTTNADGEAEIELPADWYTITETDAPDNVEIDPTPHEVELKPGQTYELKLTNVLKKQLIIEKRDSVTNELVPGMIFEIKSPEGDLFGPGNCGRGEGIYQTDTDGRITFDTMETGTSWVITELEAPAGYVLNNTPQTVKIVNDVTTVIIRNDQKPGLLLTKVDADTGKRIMGAKFTFTIPGTQTVYTRVTDNNGVIFLEDLDVTSIVIQEIEPAPGYIANDKPVTVQLKPNERTDVTFKNTSRPGLRICKIDTDGNPVANVVIKVSKADGQSMGEYTTDDSGIIYIPNLEAGTYEVQEISAPPQYVVDSTVHRVTLEAGKIGEITLRNSVKPTLRIVKVDSVTKAPIKGVAFEVRVTDGVKIGDYVTDENGEILVTGLQAGTNYTIKETATLPGYILDETPKQVTLKENEVTTIQFENKAKSPVYILKLDSETSEGIPGVTFRVTMADGSLVDEVTTDATGRATLTNVPAGYITVTEIRVPDGYVLDSTPQTKLVDGENPVTFTFYNKPFGNLLIKKLNAETQNPLSGAMFKVTTADGTLVGDRYTTGADGTVLVSGLDPNQTYIVTETRAPAGFEISESAKTITVKPGETVELVFEDKRIENFTIRKTDTSGNPMAGVTFKVSKLSGEEIATVTTGADGLAVLTDIEPGSYKVEEIKVPEGVLLDRTPQTVEVKAGEETTVTFVNKYLREFVIRKTDTAGNPMSGVTFKVTTLEGTEIATVTTGENGIASIQNMEPGTYRVQEIKVPEGVLLDSTPQDVKVEADKVTTVTFVNKYLREFTIRKMDTDGKPIPGVTFRVTTTTGTEIATVTTGVDGIASIQNMEPGTYRVQEIAVPSGVLLNPIPQTVTVVADKPTTVTFVNEYLQELTIRKVDNDGKPIANVTFKVSTIEGVEIATVTTGTDGLAVVPDILPGHYKVQEVKVPDGVILDSTPQTVTIIAGKPATLTFVNDYVGGLRIVKTVTQSGNPLKNVTFKITKPDGALIGEYTTNEDGEIFVELEPQTVIVREIKVPSGYEMDTTPRTVEIKPNETTVLEFENDRLGSIVIHKIDSDTHRGLYGAVFLLMDEDRHTIAQLVTDRDGYAELDEDIPDGVYYLREIKAPSGYTLDDRIKRIVVKNGSTEEIVWENSKTRGQIQIIKKSADYNPITGKPAGSLLEGAIFEIINADTGVVVDRVVSDYRGVAASNPLPIGRYKIREITAPAYYQLNTTEFEVRIKIPNDVVQVEVLNSTANISTSVKKQGNTTVTPGQQMRYDFYDICNLSNVALNNFYWHDQIPTDAVRLNVIHTGTWNQPGLVYSVTYKTNLNSSYRTLASGLLTTQSYDLDCSASKLGLMSGEYVTDFRFEFGTVKAGFREESRPMILVTVNQGLTNGYRFANRTDVGGKYGDKWFTSDFTWVTQVIAPPIKYPTTGY